MTGKRILRLGAMLVLAGAVGQAGPDPGRRPFALLGPDQGLSSAAVVCLTQDSEGFIWMGTENGLVRYEGGQNRRWTTRDGLPSVFITSILPAPGGGLWVATPQGLVRLRAGKIEPARFGQEPANRSCQIALDGRGRLWASTAQALFVQQDDLHFEPLGDPGSPFPPVAGGRSGTLFIPWPGGLRAYRMDGSSSNWGPGDGLPEAGPQLVVEDGAGRIWAGSGRTLVMKEPGASRFEDQSHRLPASLSPNSTALLDRDGSVWLPTQNGALHLSGDQDERLDIAGGLPFRWVRTLFRDREQSLWVVGPEVARLQGGGRVRNYGLSGEASGTVVWAISRDRDGRLLVGTDDGAARLDATGLHRIPGTEGTRVKGLARDRTGTLWLVSSIGPALWLGPGQGQARPAPLGTLGQGINGVLVDHQGRVWLSHASQGILRWDPSQGRLIQEVAPAFCGASLLDVYRIAEDASGRLWAASNLGLLVRNADGHWQQFTARDGLQPNSLHGLAFLPDGSAWIHYQEPCGLTRVRLDAGRLTVLERRNQDQGLGSNLIFAVQVDPHGQTWVSTDRGLHRLDPPLHLGRHTGMASEDCAINALLAEDNQVWVGTANGLVRLDTGIPLAPPQPPQAHILAMTAGATRFEPPYTGLAPVPFRDHTVTFRIAAPTYSDPQALHFQVRLQGLEEAWRDPETLNVRYPALPGGTYRFEARAALAEGGYGPLAGLAFTVQPPWWRTGWASLLAMITAAGAAMGLVRIRVQALARSKAALEALVALRTTELSARNDQLSAALGNVKQLSGLLPICANCKKIRDDGGYWNQLEAYLTQHSDVDFSHGICPDCVPLIYPELAGAGADAQDSATKITAKHKCRNSGTMPK